MNPIERRKSPRVALSVPAEIRIKNFPDQAYEAEVLDISIGGAFLHCTAPIYLGQEIYIRIFFKKAEVFDAKVVEGSSAPPISKEASDIEKSVIRWVRGSSKSGFGVEFLDLSADQTAFLQQLVDFFQGKESNKKR